MLKFLHCADLHLDSPFKGLTYLPKRIFERIQNSTFTSFTKIASLAIREQVDFIVVAGDIYDGESRSLRAQTLLKKELERLGENKISVYMIHGNHDHLEGKWIDLDWPENVHIFPGGNPESVPFYKNGKLAAMLHGFSYEKRSVPDNRIAYYPEKMDDVCHIGILHGNAEGQTGHETYAPFKVSELMEKGYDYWALGHIHKRLELNQDPPVIYPGNIQGRNPKETGGKGCYIIDYTGRKCIPAFRETHDILWEKAVIDLSEVTEMAGVLEACTEVKEKARQHGKGVLLNLTLQGHSPLFAEVGEGFIEELLETLQDGEEETESFVYPYALDNQVMRSWDRNQLLLDGGFIGDLLNNAEDYHGVPTAAKELFTHKKARKYLTPLRSDEEEEIVQEAETLLLRYLLKE